MRVIAIPCGTGPTMTFRSILEAASGFHTDWQKVREGIETGKPVKVGKDYIMGGGRYWCFDHELKENGK